MGTPAGQGVGLLLAIAASWVAVAQLARATEQRSEEVQHQSVVPLMTWANSTAWIILALPFALRHAGSSLDDAETRAPAWSPPCLRPRIFRSPQQPAQFLGVALATNFSYIAALHYLPASLNTAIFCTNPVFTLLLSAAFLQSDPQQQHAQTLLSTLCAAKRQGLGVLLSVVGVVLVAEPWTAAVATRDVIARLCGVALSIVSAVGTASYQVLFKNTFGDLMPPDEVGLFLAHMGVLCSTLFGALLLLLAREGIYNIDLLSVPWSLVAATAASSALFNFLIKFGLSRGSPVAVSLATQIGIPLNLLLDVLVVHARIHPAQAVGTLLLLASFVLSTSSKPVASHADPSGQRAAALQRLLGKGAADAS